MVKSKKWQCDDRRAYLFHNLCDSHKTYLCPPTHRRADPPAAENCRCCRVPERPCRSQLDQAPKEPAGSITVQPYAAVAAVKQG